MFITERNRSNGWNATQHSLDATFRRGWRLDPRVGKGHGTTGRDELHDSFCDFFRACFIRDFNQHLTNRSQILNIS